MGEQGYEGASTRDMAAAAGVSVAALYHHFPSKHDLLREFLDEAWSIVLARLDRRLRTVPPTPPARLGEIVATLIASYVHDDFALSASNVALREYNRLDPPQRRAIEAKIDRLLRLVEREVVAGIASGDFTTSEPREAARAIILLCAALIGPYPSMGRTMPEVISLYQGFAGSLVGSTVPLQPDSQQN